MKDFFLHVTQITKVYMDSFKIYNYKIWLNKHEIISILTSRVYDTF